MSKRVRITIPTMTQGGRSGFKVENLDAFVNDFKLLPKEIQAEIRKGAKSLIKPTVNRAKQLAKGGDKQQPMMAAAIRGDFFLGAPAIVASGSTKLHPKRTSVRERDPKTGKFKTKSKRRKPLLAGELFAGAEFGSNKYKQFPKRTARLGVGNAGYYFFRAIREMDGKRLMREYLNRVDIALSKIRD